MPQTQTAGLRYGRQADAQGALGVTLTRAAGPAQHKGKYAHGGAKKQRRRRFGSCYIVVSEVRHPVIAHRRGTAAVPEKISVG